jgi:hypothetical protein
MEFLPTGQFMTFCIGGQEDAGVDATRFLRRGLLIAKT